jgi:hypothetical protein
MYLIERIYKMKINIDKLLVNIKNPRFDPVTSQENAILEMAKDQKDKLYKLANHIFEHGLNPTDLTIVTPHPEKKGYHIVLEGNRRISAIKVINNPSLIKELPSLYNKFSNLNKESDFSNFKSIPCTVFDNMEEANKWIELKHTGQNAGIGTVTWNSTQVKRFQETRGKKPKVLQVFEYAKKMNNLDSIVLQHIEDISITNLERLISDPYVREFLGIDFEDGNLTTNYPREEVNKGLGKMISDLALKNINVNDIRKKEDRIKYIESFSENSIADKSKVMGEIINLSKEGSPIKQETLFNIQEEHEPNDLLQGDVKENIPEDLLKGTKEGKIDEKKVNRTVSKPLHTKRRSLIPTHVILKIDHPRINKIYYELKRLDLKDFENAASILLRVFIELSLDKYSAEHLSNYHVHDNLNVKIKKVADFMESKKILDKFALKPVRLAVSSSDLLFSTNTLNSYVHNKDVTPKANDLKITWDNMEKFIKVLWD